MTKRWMSHNLQIAQGLYLILQLTMVIVVKRDAVKFLFQTAHNL